MICRLNWLLPEDPFVSRNKLPLLRRLRLELPDVSIVAADWREIRPDHTVRIFEPEHGRERRVSLEELDLLYVYRLGHASNRGAALKEKWRELREKLELLDERGVRCVNSTAAIRKGLSKAYLLELAARGFRVPRTVRLPVSTPLEALREVAEGRYCLIKPDNGECGRFVLPLHRLTGAQLRQLESQTDSLLVQQFVPDVLAGEKSLAFLGDELVSSVRKIPSPYDLRANSSHTGAEIVRYAPTAAELTLARAAAAAFGPALEAYRVDLVGEKERLTLMELETVDPSHYRLPDPTYARALARFFWRLLSTTA